MNERSYIINTSELVIRFGNILESKADVIVSSDDNFISMGGGVSGAILAKGGHEILKDAQKKVPAELGDAIVTTAGNLPQKYVFHCITLDFANGRRLTVPQNSDLQKFIVRHSVEKCLQLMVLLDVDSIAFPSIGAGLAKIPIEDVAASMVEIITTFLHMTNNRYRIELYLFDRFNQMSMMDYMMFFENVATNIKLLQLKNIPTNQQTIEKKVGNNDSRANNIGKMAVHKPTDEHIVFVSYSRKDMDLAKVFCKQMDTLGISYWIDVEGKYHGEDFRETIVDAIEQSKLVLFLSSENANKSLYVQNEVSYAISSKIKVLPVRLDDSQYAKCLRLDLTNKQWINYFNNPESGINDFVQTLQLLFKTPTMENQ